MVRLDVGLSGATWAVFAGCLIPVIALADLGAGAIVWMFLTSSEVAFVGVLLALPLLLLNLYLAVMLLHLWRGAFWLDGRVLVRRGVFGRTRYDLSTARIDAESARPWNWRGGVLPRLVVRAPGRAPVRMWLREPARGGALLPSHQLALLARAVDPELRHPVAGRLWELASDPLRGVL